jgi:hypothetical protein
VDAPPIINQPKKRNQQMNAEAITVIDRSMTEALQLSRDAMDLELSPIRRAISQAACLDTLRKTISEHPEVMNVITGLQGSPLGFLTDKDKANGYPASTLADCAMFERSAVL